MVITKMICDFCKKEMSHVQYAINVKHISGDPTVLQTDDLYEDERLLLDRHFDCCKTCMDKLALKYGKGGEL